MTCQVFRLNSGRGGRDDRFHLDLPVRLYVGLFGAAVFFRARLDAHGRDYRRNGVEAISLRQLFTADPNNILLKLNFFGE